MCSPSSRRVLVMICDSHELAFLRAMIVIPRVLFHYSASVSTSMQVLISPHSLGVTAFQHHIVHMLSDLNLIRRI